MFLNKWGTQTGWLHSWTWVSGEHVSRRFYLLNNLTRPPGPGPKRRRTPVEQLRAWADEWPIKERVVGTLDLAIRSTNQMCSPALASPPVLSPPVLRLSHHSLSKFSSLTASIGALTDHH